MSKRGEYTANSNPSTHITQVKHGSVVKGNLLSKDSIRVDGHITGDLVSDEKIIIGGNGQIGGNLNGVDITVEGFVNGDVVAKGFLQITTEAKIYGKIFAKEISIEKGAELNGKVNVGKEVDIPEMNTTSPTRSLKSTVATGTSAEQVDKNDNYGSVAW